MAGGMPIGENGQWLFTTEQLAELVRLAGGASDLIELHDRLERSGKKVVLTV